MKFPLVQTGVEWNEMADARRTFILACALISVILVLGKATLDAKFEFCSELASAIAFCLILPFPKLRNNKFLIVAIVMIITLVHLVACAAITVFVWNNRRSTFWYAYDIHQSRRKGVSSCLALTSVRICGAPLLVMFGTVRVGLGHRTMMGLGLAMILAGIVALVSIVLKTQREMNSEVVTMLTWGMSPGLFAIALLYDNEKHMLRSRELAVKEQVALANQVRTVGYIFHEVRNPLNNILLACEIVRQALCSHKKSAKRSIGLGNSNKPNMQPHPQHHKEQHIEASSGILLPQVNKLTQLQQPQQQQESQTHELDKPHTPQLVTTSSSTSQEDSPTTTMTANTTDLPHWTKQEHIPNEMLLERELELEQLIDDIRHSAASAVTVLNDALNLQKLQCGAFEFAIKPFDLHELIESTVRIVTPQMKTKNILISTDFAPSLTNIMVEGDVIRLQQVLVNFLSNAYKFTPPSGQVQVRVRQVGLAQDIESDHHHHHHQQQQHESARHCGRTVRVHTSVFNTGEGIRPEDKHKLFQPWSQIRAGDQQQGQGSGLGLALCKAFVENGHNGTVGFESEPGNGTEFFFDIPFVLVEPENPTHNMAVRCDQSPPHRSRVIAAPPASILGGSPFLHATSLTASATTATTATTASSTSSSWLGLVSFHNHNSSHNNNNNNKDNNNNINNNGGFTHSYLKGFLSHHHHNQSNNSNNDTTNINGNSDNSTSSTNHISIGNSPRLKRSLSSGSCPSSQLSFQRPFDSHHNTNNTTSDNTNHTTNACPPLPTRTHTPSLPSSPTTAVSKFKSQLFELGNLRAHSPTTAMKTRNTKTKTKTNNNNNNNNRKHHVTVNIDSDNDDIDHTNTTTYNNSTLTKTNSSESHSRGDGSRDDDDHQQHVLVDDQVHSHVVDVLIVEDSAMSRRLLSRTLAAMGVTCDQANDGLEAVEMIGRLGVGYYRVILMDKEMPRMDGYEATKMIRELGYHRAIIGCTGNAMDDQVKEFLGVGADVVISKPITQNTIAVTLQNFGLHVESCSP